MGFKLPSNNEAKYKALIHGMRMAKALGCARMMIYGDSKLVVEQTMKACDVLADNMIAYRDLYNMMEGEFEGWELRHIRRESNEEADMLANLGSTKSQIPPGIILNTGQSNQSRQLQSHPHKLKRRHPLQRTCQSRCISQKQHGHIPSLHTCSVANYQKT